MSRVLICIAWPYANGPIHLGHVAGSLLPPDIFGRYNRLLGNEVWVVGGSDQHGTPITVTAESEGVPPEAVADRYHEINKRAIEGLGIEYTLYSKTHCRAHVEVTQRVFGALLENGHIYTKDECEYYCPKCAKFLPDRYVEGACPNCGAADVRSDQCDNCGTTFVPGDLLDPHCMHCGTRPEVRSSTHFFLRLSAFERPLLEMLGEREHWRPNVRAYTERFLRGGLKDRAITRDMSWGVPIPVEGEEWRSKVIYVWFDAVIGYLSASIIHSRDIGEPDKWMEFWKDPECRSYYFIGKDNIPFHAIIWPAMLMGMEDGFNMPYDIPANEYLTFNGGKLSKSRTGAAGGAESLMPRDIPRVLEKFDPEEIRYYLSAIMPDAHDAEFSWEDFETKVNKELVAALGNFYHRTLGFAQKNFGSIPGNDGPDPRVTEAIERALAEYRGHLRDCGFKKGLQAVMGLAHFGNEYFNSCTPWKLIKADREACGRALNESIRIARALAIMAWPYLPRSSERVWGFMNLGGSIEGAGLDAALGPLPAGTELKEPAPVYAKVDIRVAYPELFKQPETGRGRQKGAGGEAPAEPFADFRRLDLRVGRVLMAEDHPDADRLFKLSIDLGEGSPRTICAGLKDFYTREQMEGRKVIVAANLAPRQLRGVVSRGMCLAADRENADGSETVLLLRPSDPDVPVGTRFDCGMGGSSDEIDYKRHFSKVRMEVSSVRDGTFVSLGRRIELPEGAPARVAAVVDGERIAVLGDGRGCVATVDGEIQDGAGVR